MERWKPAHNPWLIAVTVSVATFMEVMDSSILNVALPNVAGGLSAGQDEATWVLTSYLVANAVVLPLSAWLCDVFGRKRFYMTCVALFTASSLLCGLAPSLAMLVLLRTIQGAAGGGLAPSEQAILADTFEPRQQGQAFALYGLAIVFAPAVGPFLGGWLTDHLSWRWIFFVNIPFGLLSLYLSSRFVQDPPHAQKKPEAGRRADYLGILLISLCLGPLQVVLDKGQREDWFETSYITVFTVLSSISLVLFIVWELRKSHPVIDISIFKDRTFAIANILMFFVGFALYSSTLLLPQLTQTLMGYSAEKSGELLSPGGIALVVTMPLVGFLTSKVQSRFLTGLGFLIISLSLFHMTHFELGMDFRTAMWARIYQSISLGLLFIPINAAAFADLPQEKNNNASALLNLCRNIGASFGISVVTTLLARRGQYHQTVLASRSGSQVFLQQRDAIGNLLTHGGAIVTHAKEMAQGEIYRTIVQQANMLAYIDAFWVLGVATACMVPLIFLMKPNKPGENAPGH